MPSVMQRVGTPNSRHNLDEKYRAKLENVDPSLSKHNEVVQHKTVEEIYQEHLQPAFEEFNERQKRKDRRLDVKYDCTTYLEYQRALDKKAQSSSNNIDKKGRPPIREIVWQFGNPEQGFGSANQTDKNRKAVRDMLVECHKLAVERYPQLKWGDVVFHADEVSKDAEDNDMGSLHLHAAFVPLCYQNKQGPGVQVAMERCLKEMGFTTFEAWKHDLDNIMETVLERHGMTRTYMDNHEKHQNSTEFHRQQEVIKQTKELESAREEANKQKRILEARIDDAFETYDKLNDKILELRAAVAEPEELEAVNITRGFGSVKMSPVSAADKVIDSARGAAAAKYALDKSAAQYDKMSDQYEQMMDDLEKANREAALLREENSKLMLKHAEAEEQRRLLEKQNRELHLTLEQEKKRTFRLTEALTNAMDKLKDLLGNTKFGGWLADLFGKEYDPMLAYMKPEEVTEYLKKSEREYIEMNYGRSR